MHDLHYNADMATTQRSEVPPRRGTLCCTSCGYGDYAAKRSAATSRNVVLYIVRIWRNGKRAALRMLWLTPWGFKSPYPHQSLKSVFLFSNKTLARLFKILLTFTYKAKE